MNIIKEHKEMASNVVQTPVSKDKNYWLQVTVNCVPNTKLYSIAINAGDLFVMRGKETMNLESVNLVAHTRDNKNSTFVDLTNVRPEKNF